MNHYYKSYWEESTGDELTNSWGTSTFYFETDEQLYVIRQIQIFEKGQILKYDSNFKGDEFGILAEKALEIYAYKECEILKEEFVNVWNNTQITTK